MGEMQTGGPRRKLSTQARGGASPEVPEWLAKIVAALALREGIDVDQVVRLLIIQGALAYEKAYREEGLEGR